MCVRGKEGGHKKVESKDIKRVSVHADGIVN